jgi:UDP-glucose:(heptosyl)LPS alpha-1,3-glucosyltransferase
MQIAVSSTDFNLVGGAERVALEAANWLARAGHEVTAYGVRIDRKALDGAVRVHQIDVPAKLDVLTGFGFRRRAAAAIQADRPDVHGAFCGLSPLGGVFWVPVVSRVGYDLLLSRRSTIGRLPVRLNPFHRGRLWLERSMLAPGGCAKLLALTERVKSDIVGVYGVPAGDIGVLAPGFDPQTFNPERRQRSRVEARARFGYGDEDRVLLFVGNELERKGFDVVLEAVGLLQDPTVKLLGAGHVAPDAEAYKSQIERLGLTDRLQWVGSSSDVALLHAAGDAFVLPTRYEPWGLVIVEALGSGLPVVTSQVAGAAIAVADGETGRLLGDPEDPAELAGALRWALSGEAADAQAIAASVLEYTWSQVIARYECVLSAVAAERSPHSGRGPSAGLTAPVLDGSSQAFPLPPRAS